jgi:hypothetical protein
LIKNDSLRGEINYFCFLDETLLALTQTNQFQIRLQTLLNKHSQRTTKITPTKRKPEQAGAIQIKR